MRTASAAGLVLLTICILACAGCSAGGDATTTTTGADLAFTSLSSSPGSPAVGDQVTVTAVLYNAGTAASTATSYSYTFQGDTSVGALAAIGAGESATLSFTVQSATAGTYAVALTLDPSGAVSETNESNNTRSRSITWTADVGGNLSVDALAVVDATLTPGATASVTATVSYAVSGTATAALSVPWRIVRADAATVALASGTLTVSADGSVTRTLDFTDADGLGTDGYIFQIDYAGIYTESLETDNSASFSIVWSSSG